ncbi:MAG: hypothetical protein IMY73_03125 [Bacteroidetes bacterium]|nr:hypothetical protein [Bacteroidota bacterium]
MKVIELGASSLCSIESIYNIKNVVKQFENNNKQILLIVPSLCWIDDILKSSAILASKGDVSYKVSLSTIQRRHFSLIEGLLTRDDNEKVISLLENLYSELSDKFSDIYKRKNISKEELNSISKYGSKAMTIIVNMIIDNSVIIENNNSLEAKNNQLYKVLIIANGEEFYKKNSKLIINSLNNNLENKNITYYPQLAI